jgi:hypothetical protein
LLEGVEWGEFKIEDLFYSYNGNFDIKKEHINNKGYYVITAGLTNNGILGKSDVEAKIFDEKTITIDMFGFAFFRQFQYKMVTHARVFALVPKFKITNNQGLFLANSFHFFNKLFGYENMCSWAKIKNEKIKLPILENGEINFSFMEKFIAELEETHLAELEAYLLATGLKNYNLTEQEEQVLKDFENGKFELSQFRIEDVLSWQKQKEIDPLKLGILKDEAEELYPFYGQATINNGIISYNQLISDVLNNIHGKPTILIHSNNQNIVYLETPFYLKDGHGATSVLQSNQLNKINQMFIIASINKVIKIKYSYNNKATKIELKNTIIELPIKDNQPDYKAMELLISAIQKLVIKDVVLYADKKLSTTKDVINKH